MKTLLRLIFGWIARLREQGLSILLAEQNARLSRAIADRGYVIENGRVKLSGSGRELLRSKEVARRYLGVGANLGKRAARSSADLAGKVRAVLAG